MNDHFVETTSPSSSFSEDIAAPMSVNTLDPPEDTVSGSDRYSTTGPGSSRLENLPDDILTAVFNAVPDSSVRALCFTSKSLESKLLLYYRSRIPLSFTFRTPRIPFRPEAPIKPTQWECWVRYTQSKKSSRVTMDPCRHVKELKIGFEYRWRIATSLASLAAIGGPPLFSEMAQEFSQHERVTKSERPLFSDCKRLIASVLFFEWLASPLVERPSQRKATKRRDYCTKRNILCSLIDPEEVVVTTICALPRRDDQNASNRLQLEVLDNLQQAWPTAKFRWRHERSLDGSFTKCDYV